VRNAYFDVLRFRDNLAYRETSVELAKRVLEENRARVRAGVLPPVETLEAEVGLKLRERELLDAQRAYHEAIDALALLLNMTGEITVADEPLTQPDLHADEAEGFRSAMVRRPDLQGRLREIERLQIERTVARNRTLPALDLSARYGHGGLRDSYSDALDDLASRSLRSWEVGVLFSYPIGNREARNDLLVSDLRLKGRRALLSQLEDDIRQEIRSAIRLLEVNRAMIEVTELGTALAQERLDSLLKRRDVGLATTRDVLEGEEDLAQARTLHIAALADYNGGITEYLRATGILLESQGIYFAGDLDPRAERPLLRIAE
jgi:outer membrane protein